MSGPDPGHYALAGAFLDEVAPDAAESFVNQATALMLCHRSKFWFNCNLAALSIGFIRVGAQSRSRKMMYLHFTMDDNLSLSEDIKARYRSQYSGVFYQRYILGPWTVAEGLVYDMFDRKQHVIDVLPELSPKAPTWLATLAPRTATVLLFQKQADADCWINHPGNITTADRNKAAKRPVGEYTDLKGVVGRPQARDEIIVDRRPATDRRAAKEQLYPDPGKQRRSERHTGFDADHAADQAVEDPQRLQAHAGRVLACTLGIQIRTTTPC